MAEFNDRREYRGEHQPPEDSAPLHDLSNQDIGSFPKDVYSTLQYYTHEMPPNAADQEAMRAVTRAKGKPDQMTWIHRSVPKHLTEETINPGDWVTISRSYAEQHGRQWEGGHRRIAKRVPAHELRTGGNDILEWGWWPKQ